jgi:hypothetical protein
MQEGILMDNPDVDFSRESISSLDYPLLQIPSPDIQFDCDDDIDALHGEALSLEASPRVASARVMDWCSRAHDRLAALDNPSDIARWQEQLGPFFLRSPFLDRAWRKPRGYAGDYLTIQAMYDATPSGATAFERGVDAWALDQPCPKAVRNRRGLVTALVGELAARFPGENLSVTSLGCGPAAEAFDPACPDNVSFTLVDVDVDAIRFVRNRAETYGMGDRITPVLGNILRLTCGRSIALPGNQHGVYSLGLIDYFSDEFVIRLLDYMHARLRKGGMLLLGNFRPGHPNAAFFRHVLDWPLQLRSEQQLRALVAQSKFAGAPPRIGAETEGVQLFVQCVKA